MTLSETALSLSTMLSILFLPMTLSTTLACCGECLPLYYPDRDGDGFGDRDAPVAAETPPDGYIEAGGDCDDQDPLRFPSVTDDPGWHPDTCGVGKLLDPVDNPTDWRVVALAGAESYAGLSIEAGCSGQGLALSYGLGAPRSGESGAWAVIRREFPSPIDLTGQDFLYFPVGGEAWQQAFTVELKLESSGGCRSTVALEKATNLPVLRTAVFSLKQFSLPGTALCGTGVTDLTAITAIEIAVSSPEGNGSGILHLDDLTTVSLEQVRLETSHFECLADAPALRDRIVTDLMAHQQAHGFIPTWYDEPTAAFNAYGQSLALLGLSLYVEETHDAAATDAARLLGEALINTQLPDGRWADVYQNNGQGGLEPVGGDSATTWVGNQGWILISLRRFSDVLGSNAQLEQALSRGGDWLEVQADAYEASGGERGGITDGTEGNISSYFGFLAARRHARADAVAEFLLTELWDAEQSWFWMGGGTPWPAIDVMGNWGVEFLRHRGMHLEALQALSLAAGIFPVVAFDGSWTGMGDISGPWQPVVEFSAQFSAVGGRGSQTLYDQALTREVDLEGEGTPDGAFPMASAPYDGGPGWNEDWIGSPPACWMLLAQYPGFLQQL